MNRRLIVAFAVVSSLMLVTAMPATAATTNTAVVSQHTDFGTGNETEPQTLNNITIDGSGDEAQAVLATNRFETFESFEDGDLSEYTEDTGSFSVVSDRSTDGSQALYSDSNNQKIISTTGLDRYPEKGDSFKTDVYLESGGGTWLIFGYQNSSNYYRVGIHGGDDELLIEKTEDGVTTELDSVPYSPTYGEWITIETEWGADGTISATVLNGGVEEATTTGQDGTFDSGGIGVDTSPQNDVYEHWWDNFRIETATESAQYISANHSASNAQQAAINISDASNVSVDLAAEYHDGSAWQSGATTTVSTAENHTLSLPDVSSSTWRVKADVSVTGKNPQFALSDESILATNHAPEINNASASPSSGETLTETPVELSINSSDADFSTSQGDNVTVDFYVDDGLVGSDTISSNGTASVSADITTGGDYTWYAIARDDYGGETQSDTFSFTAPGQLEVYNEALYPELVNDTQVNATIYVGDDTYYRSDNDGTIDLSGLPADEQIIVEVEAQGYADRVITIDSLYEQQAIYLLGDSTASVDVAFQVDDSTGSFSGDDVELLVQRPINQSNTTEWRTVIGNEIGANNKLPTTLEEGTRYRLVVRNDQESRVLGSYKAIQSVDPEILPIGTVQISEEAKDGTSFGAKLDIIENDDGTEDRLVRLAYFDSADATDELTYRIVRTDTDTEEVIVANTTETNPSQRFAATIPINSSHPQDASYRVDYWVERSGQPDVSGDRLIGKVPEIGEGWDIDDRVLRWLGYAFIVGFAGLTVVRSPRMASVGTVVIASLLSMIGVVPINPILLGMAGAVALLYNVGRSGVT